MPGERAQGVVGGAGSPEPASTPRSTEAGAGTSRGPAVDDDAPRTGRPPRRTGPRRPRPSTAHGPADHERLHVLLRTDAPITTVPSTTAPPPELVPPSTAVPVRTQLAPATRVRTCGPCRPGWRGLRVWNGDPDGRYGGLTEQAVVAVPKVHALPVDGIASPEVLAKLANPLPLLAGQPDRRPRRGGRRPRAGCAGAWCCWRPGAVRGPATADRDRVSARGPPARPGAHCVAYGGLDPRRSARLRRLPWEADPGATPALVGIAWAPAWHFDERHRWSTADDLGAAGRGRAPTACDLRVWPALAHLDLGSVMARRPVAPGGWTSLVPCSRWASAGPVSLAPTRRAPAGVAVDAGVVPRHRRSSPRRLTGRGATSARRHDPRHARARTSSRTARVG